MDAMWSELNNDVIESIFKQLSLESVSRFRRVCRQWNNLLSGEYFLAWRRDNMKEDLWVFIVNDQKDCYRLIVSTKEVKAFPVNRSIWASVGGIVLTSDHKVWSEELFLYNLLNGKETQIPQMIDFPKEDCVIVCNPARETFVQLPQGKLNKEHGIRVGEILWKGNQYQVVAVYRCFIEVYDFSNQSWVTIQRLPERTATSIVFYKGLFFCTVCEYNVHAKCGVMVFSITEDCTCHMVNIFLPIPKTYPLWLEPHLFVRGSELIIVRQDSFQLYLWELEYDNNLNTTLNLSWKEMAVMPQEVLQFANLGFDLTKQRKLFSLPGRFKCFAAGNYICFVREGSGNVVFFNTENRSWSCFSVVDNVEQCATADNAYGFEPRIELPIQ